MVAWTRMYYSYEGDVDPSNTGYILHGELIGFADICEVREKEKSRTYLQDFGSKQLKGYDYY